MIKAVIIGTGGFSHMHAKTYDLMDDAKLVACANKSNIERRKEFAKEFSLRDYDDVREMIINEAPDIVHIVTKPDARYELMKLVDSLGVRACIVEKPIAFKVIDYLKIKELLKNSKTCFAMSAQFRYHPYMQKCIEASKDPKIGRLISLDASAGMNLANQGPHILDWAMALNDDKNIVKVFANSSNLDKKDIGHLAPSNVIAQLMFENNVPLHFCLGELCTRVRNHKEIYKHCRVRGTFENGYVSFEEFGDTIIQIGDKKIVYEFDEDSLAKNNHFAQAALFREVYDWSNGKEKSKMNAEKSLDQWLIMLGMYKSSLERKIVDGLFKPDIELVNKLFIELEK